MTTIILAQKLNSVKLCKNEYEKSKWLKSNNMEEKYKIIRPLRQILENQVSKKTCRLCLKNGEIRIFGDNEDFDFMANIKYILGIEVRESDGKPQHICTSCESTLREAVKLKHTAENTQWRLQQELEMVTQTGSDNENYGDNVHTYFSESNLLNGGYFTERGSTVVREWRCIRCRTVFNTQEEFSQHEIYPTCSKKSKCYMCETCGLELKTMTRLKRHRLIHTGELHYPCTVCPYRGRTKYALVVHERSHSGTRPVSCPSCSATFLNSSNLASHKRRHMPPKYHCHLCEKSFRFKEALHNHIATQHSTAKPHICNACGKAFSTRKMICRHERRVHNRPKMRSGIVPTYLRQQEDT